MEEPRPVEEILTDLMRVSGLAGLREKLGARTEEHTKAKNRMFDLAAEIAGIRAHIAKGEVELGDRDHDSLMAELTAAQDYFSARAEGSRTCRVKCPECGKIVGGMITFKYPFSSYYAECLCGYLITESEWEEVPYGAEAGGE